MVRAGKISVRVSIGEDSMNPGNPIVQLWEGARPSAFGQDAKRVFQSWQTREQVISDLSRPLQFWQNPHEMASCGARDGSNQVNFSNSQRDGLLDIDQTREVTPRPSKNNSPLKREFDRHRNEPVRQNGMAWRSVVTSTSKSSTQTLSSSKSWCCVS